MTTSTGKALRRASPPKEVRSVIATFLIWACVSSPAIADVPDRVRYGMFVANYEARFRESLIQDLSPRDDSILYSLNVNEVSQQEDELSNYNKELLTLCTRRYSANLRAIATQYDQLAAQFWDKRVARYKAAIRQLSPQGQAVVEQFIRAEIEPNVRVGRLADSVAKAERDPDAFSEQLDEECHIAEYGQSPPISDVSADHQQKVHETLEQRSEAAERLIKPSKEDE